MANILNADIKTFVERSLSDACASIECDPREFLPKYSEIFVSKILKDKNGNLCENEPVHFAFHRFRRKALKNGYKKMLILGAFGHGKSMISGTYVLMYDCSIKTIDNVKVGDFLMGDDGTPRKVLALGSGKEQSYKVVLKNKDSFSCNASHKVPFYISNRWKGYKKGDVVIMTIKDYLDQPKWVKNNVLKIQKAILNFKKKDVFLDPYLFGLWLGDGHKTGLHFTINNKDQEIVNYLYKWASINNFEVRVEDQLGDCTRYDLTHGKGNSKKYPELEFVKSCYIKEKRIDLDYLKNDRNIRLQVLAGLLDTDGHLFDKCFEWSTKFEGLKDDFLFLCRSLGFSVSHRTKYVNGTPYYVIIISGDTHLIPCKTRKKASKRKKIKNPLVYGFDVEDIGKQKYYGVVLDKNHLYLQDDFTIHHNTEQMCIGLCLEKIAKNPDIRIKIVHVSEDEATNRVRSIKDYITKDDNFKEMCPHIVPTNIWGSNKLIVKRKSFSKDPTLQGFSVQSAAIGGRADFLIFDDPQDFKTSILEPSTRQNIEDLFKNIWMSRLDSEDSEAIVLMNSWCEEDLANGYITKNPMWAWMKLGVNEDKESLFYEDSFGDKRTLPLWSKFGKQELIDRHVDLGDKDYNRGYRLIPFSDKDKTFPNFTSCCRYGIKAFTLVDEYRDWVFVGGIDFAGMKRPGTNLVILAVNKYTGEKIPVDLYSFIGPSSLADAIVETWRRYGVELYMAENNATQGAITDLLQTKLDGNEFSRYNIKIEGFNTGKNKADPLVGLPAMQKEMEKLEWTFCFAKDYDKDRASKDLDKEKDLWYRFYMEMKNHPFYSTSDFVMACWFARQAAVGLVRTSGGPNVW